jgi:hypothetical protein
VAEIESKQVPQLDDDGDGNHAAKQYINQEGISQEDAPQIIQIHDYITLPAEQARAVLWIKTSPNGEAIKKARATLIPPGLENLDLYLAIIYPQGFYQTITSPFNLSPVNTRQAYQSELNLSGEQNFSIPQL